MQKIISTVLFLLMFVSMASAESAKVDFGSSAINACVAVWIPACQADPAVRPVAKAVKRAAATKAKIVQKSNQLAALEKRLGTFGPRDPTIAASLAQLRQDVGDLKDEIEVLNDTAIPGINENMIESMRLVVARLEALEAVTRQVSLAIEAGVIGLWTINGTAYSGALVGPRLNVRLGAPTVLHLGVLGAFSFGKNESFGILARGGLEYTLSEHWGFEAGFVGGSVGFNNRLQPRAGYLLLELGPALHFGDLAISAVGFVGPGFTQAGVGSTFGGSATLVYTF